MKVKIEMIVEVSDSNAQDYEIESHICDALTEYTGNDLAFLACEIEQCLPALKTFSDDIQSVVCLENFIAGHTNSIGGEVVKTEFTFVKGITYPCESWRPEGMRVGKHFVFNRDASKFAAK